MPTHLTQAIMEAYAVASVKRTIVKTLSVFGEELGELHIVQGVRDFEAAIEGTALTVFKAVPFQLATQGQSSEGAQSITIQVDILDIQILEFFKAMIDVLTPTQVMYREWTPETGDWVSGAPLNLYVESVGLTETTATLRAGFVDIVNRSFPSALYTPTLFFPLKY